MGAPLGNNNAEYTLDEVKALVRDYIKHRAAGFSKLSFPGCDYRTIDKHLSNYSFELRAEKELLEKAEREGLLTWEKIGKTIAETGEGNPAAWIFNMKNRYPADWKDKHEIESNVTQRTTIIDTTGGTDYPVHPEAGGSEAH